jgi:hypothetical protein
LKFINGISKYILPEGEKNRIIDEKNLLDTFSDQLLEVKKNKFNFKIWLNDELKFQVKNLINELKQYRKENIIYGKSSFIYQGHFARMSSILPKIRNSDSYIKNVKIFATHSFIFDVNYKISKERYQTHSPDLIIISPKVMIENNITVDLSCDHVRFLLNIRPLFFNFFKFFFRYLDFQIVNRKLKKVIQVRMVNQGYLVIMLET